MIGKSFLTIASILACVLFFVSPTFAHVIVTPHQVGIATIQDFTISIPNEKDNPVVGVKLLIPQGLNNVVPNAVSGWTINTVTNGSGNNTSVTEIDWTEGEVPVGQRQEFVFQAQVPPQVTTLAWKAYQTYSDGTVVSWDIDPVKMEKLSDEQQDTLADKENKGEYSTTTVINDLAVTPTPTIEEEHTSLKADIALGVSVLAIIASAVAISLLRKQNLSGLQDIKRPKRR